MKDVHHAGGQSFNRNEDVLNAGPFDDVQIGVGGRDDDVGPVGAQIQFGDAFFVVEFFKISADFDDH